MILDKANIKGLSRMIKIVRIIIWVQTETSVKNQFAPAHIVTKTTTPSAYDTYIAPK